VLVLASERDLPEADLRGGCTGRGRASGTPPPGVLLTREQAVAVDKAS